MTRDYTEKEKAEIYRIIKYSEGTPNPGAITKGVPMTEAEREYIITEETRREIIDRLSKPFSEETRKEIERIKRMHDELLPVEMSRIYSSAKESSDVLDDICMRGLQKCSKDCDGCPDNYTCSESSK